MAQPVRPRGSSLSQVYGRDRMVHVTASVIALDNHSSAELMPCGCLVWNTQQQTFLLGPSVIDLSKWLSKRLSNTERPSSLRLNHCMLHPLQACRMRLPFRHTYTDSQCSSPILASAESRSWPSQLLLAGCHSKSGSAVQKGALMQSSQIIKQHSWI